jgi:speckle-type POZ protein
MAEGKFNDCVVVPTREIGQFNFRVCFSSAELPFTLRTVAISVVAGCECDAVFLRCDISDEFMLILRVRHGSNPAMEGIKVIPSMVLLDKTGSPASMGTRTTSRISDGTLVHKLDLTALLEDVRANCVVENYFQVMCSVEVIRDGAPAMAPLTAEEELPDLGHDLAMMSHKQQLTDVSFDVDGESFSAHRLVLAARSPVFRAELYGPMAESKMTSITIHDVKASTFRYMLHYMYHGSLPNPDEKGEDPLSAVDHQHLLVAADRYGVERLKGLCERKLCDDFTTVDTVVSMLALAEERACSKLKARCFDFLAKGENFKMVGTTPEYLHLMQSIPSLMLQVRNRFNFNIAHPDVIMNPPSTD